MTHRRFFALGVMFLVLSVTSYADINDGLISAWTFDDGKADDAFGNSDGILHEGAEAIDDGMNGKGMDFDGVSAYVEVPDSDAFDVMENGYSISAWAYVRVGRDHSAIAWKGEKIGWGANFTARIATTSDTNITWGACAPGIEGWFATDGVYSTNEWVHLCLTVDGSEAIGYVNTEIPPSGQANPLAVSAPYNLFKENPLEFGVGRAIGGIVGTDSYLDGTVDEIYLYDRGLTEAEVIELSTGERPRAVDAALGVDAEGKVATAWGALKAHR
jgi:hypothetical protein